MGPHLRPAGVGGGASRGPRAPPPSHRLPSARRPLPRLREGVAIARALSSFLVVLVAAVAPVVLAQSRDSGRPEGAASRPAGAPRDGGALRVAFNADPPTLDPAQATDLTSAAVIRQLFDALVELDA